jgi:hypothetical protein
MSIKGVRNIAYYLSTRVLITLHSDHTEPPEPT